MIPKSEKTNPTSERCPCPSPGGQTGWFLRFLHTQKTVTQWCAVKQLCYRTCNTLFCWRVQTHINTSAKSHINPFYSEEVRQNCDLLTNQVQSSTWDLQYSVSLPTHQYFIQGPPRFSGQITHKVHLHHTCQLSAGVCCRVRHLTETQMATEPTQPST